MSNRTKPETPAGQPLGDTGDGNTGVPDDEQGMSNRPGDRDDSRREEADDEGNAPKSGPNTTSKD